MTVFIVKQCFANSVSERVMSRRATPERLSKKGLQK
jgi:hypothetical protein